MPRPLLLYTNKPDPHWWQAQQAAFAALPRHCVERPWLKEEALELGILYYRTWRRMPSQARMDGAYCLPPPQTILRLFGTMDTFYAAIRAACEEVMCDPV